MSAQPQVSRRRAMQLMGATAAAAAGAAPATAQNETDGSDGTEETTFSPPQNFMGSSVQTIGANAVLIEMLNDPDEGAFGTWKDVMSTMGAPYFIEEFDDSTAENLQADAVLKLSTMGNRDHHVLTNIWNVVLQARNNAWLEGLVGFLDAIEASKTEDETMDAAEAAVSNYYAIPQNNHFAYWQEQMNEIEALSVALHEGLSDPDSHLYNGGGLSWGGSGGWASSVSKDIAFVDQEVTLVDGSTMTLNCPEFSYSYDWDYDDGGADGSDSFSLVFRPDQWTSLSYSGGRDTAVATRPRFNAKTDGGVQTFWGAADKTHPTSYSEAESASTDFTDWAMFNQHAVIGDWIVQEHDRMVDQIRQWALNAYGKIAAGELSTEQIIANNPMLAASEYATDYENTGHYTYAAASFASMGMAHSLPHEMVVELHDGTELRGTMLVDNEDFSVDVGSTVDPADLGGKVYFAFASESASRQLHADEFRTAIDGGELLIHQRPIQGTIYQLQTAAGEAIEITPDRFIPVDESKHLDPEATTDYTVDLEDDLESPITEVESITLTYPKGTGDSMIRIANPFTILEAYDRDSGEPVDTVEGQGTTDLSSTETQFTQEDLDAFIATMESIHDESGPSYSGGGGPLWTGMDWSWLPDLPDGNDPFLRKLAIVVAAGIGVGGAALGISKFSGDDGRARR
ncbi:hypothetical protein GCM10028857_05100 [Salinarchaeum chitinilyticum]